MRKGEDLTALLGSPAEARNRQGGTPGAYVADGKAAYVLGGPKSPGREGKRTKSRGGEQ